MPVTSSDSEVSYFCVKIHTNLVMVKLTLLTEKGRMERFRQSCGPPGRGHGRARGRAQKGRGAQSFLRSIED